MKNCMITSTLLSLIMFASSGCKKECDYWYKGDDCSIEVREDYYGVYNGTVEENDLTLIIVDDRFDVDVMFSQYPADSKGMYLTAVFTDSLYVVLTSETTFSIPFQSFAGPVFWDGYDVEGSGTFTGSQVSFTYNMVIRQDGLPDGTIVFTFNGLK